MLTDLKKWKSDAGDALPYAIGALACSALSLVCFALSGMSAVFVVVGVALFLGGMALAISAHGQDPLGSGGPAVIGVVIGSLIAGVFLLALHHGP
jgi:hypothetical protein